MTFIRTEINIVDFMFDRLDADIHILINDQNTGGGGDKYQIIFLGKNQFLMPYLGWDFRYRPGKNTEHNLFNQTDTHNKRSVVSLGLQYTMPFFIVADSRIDTDGKFRLSFSRNDIPLTERLRLRAMWNTDKEWALGAKYILTKHWALSTHYDSDMKWGAGITLQY